MDNKPQYLDAMSEARRLCKLKGETVITYYDPESGNPNHLQYCTESAWDRMIDNGQVESDWVHGWMYPEDVKKQKRDGTLHDRLLSLGWKHTYSAPRYDYYKKLGWTVRVPIHAAFPPVYSRKLNK